MLKIRCKDIGYRCEFVATANTKEAIMWTVTEHLMRDHEIKLESMTPQVRDKMRAVIHVRGV